MPCPFCDERPSVLPNGSFGDCAMDDELDERIFAAASRAYELGISFEKFLELCEACADVVAQ
jgi:hypothetical protein